MVLDLAGRQIGRRLADAGIAAANDGVGTYLDTTDPRTLPFYRRLGFADAGAVTLGPEGPVLTVLHRAHRAAPQGLTDRRAG